MEPTEAEKLKEIEERHGADAESTDSVYAYRFKQPHKDRGEFLAIVSRMQREHTAQLERIRARVEGLARWRWDRDNESVDEDAQGNMLIRSEVIAALEEGGKGG